MKEAPEPVLLYIPLMKALGLSWEEIKTPRTSNYALSSYRKSNKPPVLEIKEFISYKSSNLNQLKKINPDYWSNLLIKGNNLNTISSLLEAPFRKMIQKSGGIKLAYIDPPFFTGQDRFLNKSISKNPNINSNEKIAY